MDTPVRILVVDDEVGIQEECRRVLVPRGFEVDMAENGPLGLRKLRESRLATTAILPTEEKAGH
ncbi:MAG: hypothetical protein ACUVSG_02550 [Anaerolineae bacterium]